MEIKSKYDENGRPIKGKILNRNRSNDDPQLNIKLYMFLVVISFFLGIFGIILSVLILYQIGNRDNLTQSEATIKTLCYVSIAFNFIWFVFSFLTNSYYIF